LENGRSVRIKREEERIDMRTHLSQLSLQRCVEETHFLRALVGQYFDGLLIHLAGARYAVQGLHLGREGGRSGRAGLSEG